MSPARSPSRPVDDFDANELVKEHGRSIGELRADIDHLVVRYGDDDRFGRTFEALAHKDKRVDGAVSGILVHLIETNAAVRAAVSRTVNEADRAWLGILGKRVGFAVWSIALVVISALVGHILK